jgi:uncharacterized protein YqeY
MKEKDTLRVDTLRLLKAAIKNKEIALQKDLSDEQILGLIRTQAKQRREAIRQYLDGGRQDLAAKEDAELAILMTLLPKQLSAEAINDVVVQVINEIGAKDMKDMGRTMKTVMAKVSGTADGKLVNEIVKKRLSQ